MPEKVEDGGVPFGFSMAALLQFCDRHRSQLNDSMTTTDVCDAIVKPITQAKKCSLVELWSLEERAQNRTCFSCFSNDRTGKLVGPATVFISHVWQYNFKDLVQIITKFWEKKGRPVDMFFWYDCFVVNQHIRQVVPYEQLKTLFGESLKKIGQALIALISWQQPLYITRCWCLFELFTIIRFKIPYEMMMAEGDERNFLEQLTKGFTADDGGLFRNFVNIRSENATASIEEDANNIKTAIRTYDKGFRGLDSVVLEALRLWFLGLSRSQLTDETTEANMTITTHVANLLCDLGKFAEAEPLNQKCLVERQNVLGKEHPHTLTSLHNLAGCILAQKRYTEAELLFEQCYQARVRILGKTDPYTLTSMNNLAACYDGQRKHDEAEPLYRECFEIRKGKNGMDHPNTIRALKNLALCLDNQGKHGEAEPFFRQCWEASKKGLGNDHPDTISALNFLAECLEARGKYLEAEPLYLQCLDERRTVLGADHPETMVSINNLAGCYDSLKIFDKSEKLYRQCLEIKRNTLGDGHPSVLTTMNNLAECLYHQGKTVEAEETWRTCVADSKRLLGSKHPITMSILNGFAEMLDAQRKYSDAEAIFRECLASRLAKLGAKNRITLAMVSKLANCLKNLQKHDEADQLIREYFSDKDQAS